MDKELVSEKILEYLLETRASLRLSLSVNECLVIKESYNFSELGSDYPHPREFSTVDPRFRLVCKAWDSRLRSPILQDHGLYFEAHITMVSLLESWLSRAGLFVFVSIDEMMLTELLSVAYEKSLLLSEMGHSDDAEKSLTRLLQVRNLYHPSVPVPDARRVVDSVHFTDEFKIRFILHRFKMEERSMLGRFVQDCIPYEMLKEVYRNGGKWNVALWSRIHKSLEFVDDLDFRLECIIDPASYTTADGWPSFSVAQYCIRPRKALERLATDAMKRTASYDIFSFVFQALLKVENLDASLIDWESIAEAQPNYPFWMAMVQTRIGGSDRVLRPEYTIAAFVGDNYAKRSLLCDYLSRFIYLRWKETAERLWPSLSPAIVREVAGRLMLSESPTREAAIEFINKEIAIELDRLKHH